MCIRDRYQRRVHGKKYFIKQFNYFFYSHKTNINILTSIMASRKKQLFKIIILGDSGVGKTSLINQYVSQKFTQQYRATVGADFMAKDVQLEDRTVTLQIWDTAGQERFQSLGSAFYRGSDCCVIVYDITNMKSFEAIETWKEEFLLQGSLKDKDNFPFIILGNKADLEEQRKINQTKAQQIYQIPEKNLFFFEISAKDNLNVDQAFNCIAKAAASQEKEEEIFIPTTVNLQQTTTNQQAKKGCC
eukprot:TRINITY_DN272_c0_g2_i2.p1 TRINITY_DN272_c0_g2~~TRINITY_DN272_c0_g2_i2.p1  ORF type:complete len:260 (-),score=101.69 TRINITY_DN272_c0_g2_i2:21-755(-)